MTPEAEATGTLRGAGGVEAQEPVKEKEKWCSRRPERRRRGQRPRGPRGEHVQGGRGGRPATGHQLAVLEGTGRGRARAPDSTWTLGIGTVLVRWHAGSQGPGVGPGTWLGPCTPLRRAVRRGRGGGSHGAASATGSRAGLQCEWRGSVRGGLGAQGPGRAVNRRAHGPRRHEVRRHRPEVLPGAREPAWARPAQSYHPGQCPCVSHE